MTASPGQTPPPELVSEVFAEILAAVGFAHEWPADLRADLAGIIAASRRYGSCADTAYRMTPAEIDDFRRDLLCFAERVCQQAGRPKPDEPALAGSL
jgi:hypothetical protein